MSQGPWAVDIYNLLNANSVLSDLDEFGAALGTPTTILQGRLMRLAWQMSW